jgi:chromosomal replication initiator protein
VPSTISAIQSAVAHEFGITREELLGPSKKKKFVHPRILAMMLTRQLTGASFPLIAREFGRRDHTTALHASRRGAVLLDKYDCYEVKIHAAIKALNQPQP